MLDQKLERNQHSAVVLIVFDLCNQHRFLMYARVKLVNNTSRLTGRNLHAQTCSRIVLSKTKNYKPKGKKKILVRDRHQTLVA